LRNSTTQKEEGPKEQELGYRVSLSLLKIVKVEAIWILSFGGIEIYLIYYVVWLGFDILPLFKVHM
jgi:hypothetical protein